MGQTACDGFRPRAIVTRRSLRVDSGRIILRSMRFEPNEADRVRRAEDENEDDTDRFRRIAGRLRVGFVFAREAFDRSPLAVALERALARPVELVRAAAYTDLAETVGAGQVDLAWMPPALYVYTRRALGVRLAATVERSGADGYRSALLCRKGACERVSDVRGARAAWVDPWSAAGYLMPRAIIASEGLDPSAVLRSERFVGSYDAALEAVEAREAELAGGYCTVARDGRVLEQSWPASANVRVLDLSPPIPSDVLCTTGALSSSDAIAIEASLCRADADDVARALGGTGLARPDAAHYDALDRAILRR